MVYAQKQALAQQIMARAALFFIAMGALTFSAGCTPAFNWRDVTFEGLPVAALLPCKPERATRAVPLAGAPRQMVMAGCKAGGAMFTVAVVTATDTSQLAQVQAELKAVNKATHSQYLSHGLVVVQASVYGEPKADGDGPGALSTQAVETFLSGVKLAGTP
jgi:hypothetical protein